MTGCSHLLDNRPSGLGESTGGGMRGAQQCASPARRSTMKTGEVVCTNGAERFGITGQAVRIAVGICLAAFLASSALAQYGGGMGTGTGTPGTPGYVAPTSGYGSGKAIGIGVGAAAAGAGVLFLALHHHGVVTCCAW